MNPFAEKPMTQEEYERAKQEIHGLGDYIRANPLKTSVAFVMISRRAKTLAITAAVSIVGNAIQLLLSFN